MQKNNLTYNTKMSLSELFRYVKAIAAPIAVFILGLVTVSEFKDFGNNLLSPMQSIMWIMACITSIILPAQRNNVIKETIVTIGCYNAGLLALRFLLSIVAGTSSQMLIASFDTSIGVTQGNTMTGYLQIAMWISSVMIPVGYIGVQAKRIFSFKKMASPEKKLNQLRSIRKTNVKHIDKD